MFAVRSLLKKGVDEGVYPGSVLLVAQRDEIIFFERTGNRVLLPEPLRMEKETFFDLASLTKPLATTLSIMKLFDQGAVRMDQTLGDLLQISVPADKRSITLKHLLTHCAGFQDWAPFYLELPDDAPQKRKSSLRTRLLDLPLKYTPGRQSVYSDLGFMVLEWVIEMVAECSLRRFLNQHFLIPLSLENLLFFMSTNSQPDKIEFAATEDCPWRKRVLQGEVHDENASALGGYSGHAGLFGTATGVYALANLLREHFHGLRDDYLQPKTVRMFFDKQHLPRGSTWALGWDTPSPPVQAQGATLRRIPWDTWGLRELPCGWTSTMT